MKKFILPLLSILVLVSCSDDDKNNTEPNLPLIITKSDFDTNYKVGGATFNFFDTAPSNALLPQAGENQVWDFSMLTETSSSVNGASQFITPSNAAFSSATYAVNGGGRYGISSAVSPIYDATFFNELSDAGFFDLGASQNEATSIVVPTLGATISYQPQNNNLTGTAKVPRVLFPAKFGNPALTYNGIIQTSNFSVTALAFGLNNTPGQVKTTRDITQEVIASGVANLKGIGNTRVLVIKNSVTDTRNYFLGGAPVPTELITLLGATDGEVFTSTTYRFVGEGLGIVGLVEVDANGQVFSASFRKG